MRTPTVVSGSFDARLEVPVAIEPHRLVELRDSHAGSSSCSSAL
jgi:hypothetical protein